MQRASGPAAQNIVEKVVEIVKSSDTLLNYVFKFMQTQNKITNTKITPLQALKIYHEITKAGN